MIIKTYTKEGHPGITFTVVTLDNGDHHEWHGFVSRNAGHVIALETPGDTQWTEYDLGDPRFAERVAKLDYLGWVPQSQEGGAA